MCLELERQRIVKTDIGKIATPHSEYITVFSIYQHKKRQLFISIRRFNCGFDWTVSGWLEIEEWNLFKFIFC